MSGPQRLVRAAALAGVAVMALTACGDSGSGGGGGSESLPDSVKIMSIRQLTGVSSFAGTNSQKGIDLALQEIEQQNFLGGPKIELTTKDSVVSTQTAASFATQAVSDRSYSAILGPEASAQSTAISAIVQKAKMPTVYVQSGSSGVLTGDYTFRVTAPAASYFDVAGKYLKSKSIASAAIILASDNPTLTQLGQETIPAMSSKYGFSITGTDSVASTAQDFTSFASKMAAQKPGAIFLMLLGPQDPVVITQLRRAGYDGLVVGMSAMGSGNLKPAGQLAAGAVWPTDFSADQQQPSSQAFVKAYQAKYGDKPNNYAAEGYDAMWFLARGIKQANSADRVKVQAGLAEIAKQGFDGAMGKLKFEGTDLRVEGTLATWDGAKESVIEVAGS
jgi:branched-chain amino acid transport system substrate-binding protein